MKKSSGPVISLPCSDSGSQSYEVEAVLTIDARGQIVIPKDIRQRADIQDGDKFALISLGGRSTICCLTLIPVKTLSEKMPDFMRQIFSEKG